jgi:hypothetical protein
LGMEDAGAGFGANPGADLGVSADGRSRPPTRRLSCFATVAGCKLVDSIRCWISWACGASGEGNLVGVCRNLQGTIGTSFRNE